MKLSIKCDEQKRQKSKTRMKAYQNREYTDRVPVSFGIEARYLLKERGVSFKEYFESPESNFYNQLMNFKWRIEHIEDDFLGAEEINIFPDFQNTTTASLFNESCVVWSENETPRIAHFINTIEDLRNIKVPDMNTGVAYKKKKYILKMQEIAEDCEVEINGEPIPINVVMGWQETMFTGALDMLGQNLLLWMYEYPEDIKNFFDMMTDTCILYEKEMLKITHEKRTVTGAVADGTEMISPKQFKEFVVPYYNKFYEAFPGTIRSVHNCGNIAHLLSIFKDDLEINMLNGFGFVLDPQKIAEVVGDGFFYSGGINPMTLHDEDIDQLKRDVKRYVDILGPYRTYLLGDGYNVVPGTSVTLMNNMVKYVEELGVPKKASNING